MKIFISMLAIIVLLVGDAEAKWADYNLAIPGARVADPELASSTTFPWPVFLNPFPVHNFTTGTERQTLRISFSEAFMLLKDIQEAGI